MLTSAGYVKWVCHDHCQSSFQEKHAQTLHNVIKLAQGEFNEQLGRITISLTSSFAAAEFYSAISQAKGVLELIVDLSWEYTMSDFAALEDALKKSIVSNLRIHRQFRASHGSNQSLASPQSEVLFSFPRASEYESHSCRPSQFSIKITFSSLQVILRAPD